MTTTLSPTRPRRLTVLGLLAGAVAIAILWASGVEFPFYPPPGFLILTAGATFVALAKWPWAPAVGTALGTSMIVGFVASGAGIGILTGDAGIGGSIGSVIQLVGMAVAVVAGVVAVKQEYRRD